MNEDKEEKHHSSFVREWLHVGRQHTVISPSSTFEKDHPNVKEDIIRMIVQYLENEGYTTSSSVIQDETNVKQQEQFQKRDGIKRMLKGIHEGHWDLVAKLTTKHLRRQSQKGFLYAVCKQEYLELIERQEYQKAFTYLTTHLKPMENIARASNSHEFYDLCYLLTSSSVNEVESFRHWEGITKSREKLADQLKSTVNFDRITHLQHPDVPPDRLVHMLHQAVAYQMEFSRYHPKTVPKVTTLLDDFECTILPNVVKCTYMGHTENVKCVTFVGNEGTYLASGSSDNTINIWPVEQSTEMQDYAVNAVDNQSEQVITNPLKSFHGHTSRIWDLCSSKNGKLLFSSSGDSTVKLWNLTPDVSPNEYCQASITGHTGDVYSVSLSPGETHIVTGGYDHTIHLVDLETGTTLKNFMGHTASVSKVIFNPHGNLLVSGSKDGTIRFWDILSGLCIRTLHQTLGEVTSVECTRNGLYLLSSSKNNSNRLWDLRMDKNTRKPMEKSMFRPNISVSHNSKDGQLSMGYANPSMKTTSPSSLSTHTSAKALLGQGIHEDIPIQRFKGHQNSAKNFVRATFGPQESLILGGSEDGLVHIWDVETGKLLERLPGHTGVVYCTAWHERQALMATCSHDNTVKTWWWNKLK